MKRTKTQKAAPRVSCDELIEITGEALERACGGVGEDGGDIGAGGGGGGEQFAGKTWRDSPPNSFA